MNCEKREKWSILCAKEHLRIYNPSQKLLFRSRFDTYILDIW